MGVSRLFAGRGVLVRALVAAGLVLAAVTTTLAAGRFPYDQELLLETRPMRPIKRVPALNIASDGSAIIFLWCQTVRGRVQLTDSAIRIEPGPLPQGRPRYMIDGQCTPERMDADLATLTALLQVTGWRRQGRAVVLMGPTVLKFRPSDH